jgi:nicotinate phosphoribosyltransferase
MKYKPSELIHITGTYTDYYQFSMSQACFFNGGQNERAVFDYFFRQLPFQNGYAVFAGLDILLDILENLAIDNSDIEFLKKQGFDGQFIEYLKKFRFQGDIYSSTEGDIVFPTRPVLTVEATLIEAQLIETLLLNMLNFQTLVATKAARIRQSAGNRMLIDFGMRRAHGPAAHYAARAAIIGGFDATSNVRAGRDFDIPVAGTMAHSFVQSFDDEQAAFRCYADIWPNDAVLLVDTYDTLKSGVPNAIKVAAELMEKGYRLKGIRLDSGDLAYMAKKARKMLDDAGLNDVKIAASNQLDELIIKSLLDQKAPIDVFGVGTSLVTGQPDAALDGVYKLAQTNGTPRIKLSENTSKITLPHQKQVHRIYNENKECLGADIITLRDETELTGMHHPFDPIKSMTFDDVTSETLLQKVMKNGHRTTGSRSVRDIGGFAAARIDSLPEEYRRFDNPHIYKVGLSSRLKQERDALIKRYKEVG